MCGIAGYIGYRNAADVCINGLKRLEYRGYDSYGIAVVSGAGAAPGTAPGALSVFKSAGKISDAKDLPADFAGSIGISHTRWATHGVPNEINAHPHLDCAKKIAVVHNGIIENYAELRRGLEERGHVFLSQTDTEVIPHLIEEKFNGDLFAAVQEVLPLLSGSYAILAAAEGVNAVVAARRGSPLVLGIGDNECILASDVVPLIEYTRKVVYFEDGDAAEITPRGYKIVNGGAPVERAAAEIGWDADVVRKGGYPHYMLKEIFEQPDVFSASLLSVRENGAAVDLMRLAYSITVVACGTSANAAQFFAYLAESVCKIPVRVVLASEFRYFPTPGLHLVIGVSQSGETADTLTALKLARELGAKTLAVTNVLGSSITRAADAVIYTRAGPEISVAATKSFTSQIAVFMELVNLASGGKLQKAIGDISRYLSSVASVDVAQAADLCKDAQSLIYIGRGFSCPMALEGALKMKEISYIHAEGYAAGELKHGPFALLSPEVPVVAVSFAQDGAYPVMMSNLKEIKAREAPLVVIGTKGDRDAAEVADVFIGLPDVSGEAGAVLAIVVMQVLAYEVAVMRGCEVDMPRNLAKSVTVE